MHIKLDNSASKAYTGNSANYVRVYSASKTSSSDPEAMIGGPGAT